MILAVRVKSRSFGIAFKETSRDGFQVEARHHSACETSIPDAIRGAHDCCEICSQQKWTGTQGEYQTARDFTCSLAGSAVSRSSNVMR
jgi:hypothetical protein